MFCSFEFVVFAKSHRTSASPEKLLESSNLAGEIAEVVKSRRSIWELFKSWEKDNRFMFD
ncbi:hypothetical protein DY000_02062777 [Brassica cretica]|uniref:Uncharacterized protein n=1 Tax=Brassica cretica TaxID=69181 RepID=A0ABQ7AV09_BRACR|nr:hypothetical protein DY000_02062777 [Brassica cretica]